VPDYCFDTLTIGSATYKKALQSLDKHRLFAIVERMAKKSTYTISDMQELAKRRSGRCISESYNGLMSQLAWVCEKGHMWEAQPKRIIHGSWCPVCARVMQRAWNGRR
jgi:hypothetical protein